MKTEPNIMKRRLLLVQKLLYENTDEQHPLTTFEILDYLLEQGILKRYYKENDQIRLHPENRSMEDIIVDDCIIQGIAVKVLKDII